MQSSKQMKVSRDELTVLQGRKQFAWTLASCNVKTIEQRIFSVVQIYQKIGKYNDFNILHLMQIALFLKEKYPFLMLGDIQSMFYLSHKETIKPIEKIELIEIADVVDEYWKFCEVLILKMVEVAKSSKAQTQ